MRNMNVQLQIISTLRMFQLSFLSGINVEKIIITIIFIVIVNT